MADPIQVEVIRSGVVEAQHTVYAVAVRDGRIVAESGDPGPRTLLRSSAKPIRSSAGHRGGARVIAAMRSYPEMLRGPVAADVLLVRELDGWTAQGGAEGLFCACSPDGLGVALKVMDGAFRGIRPALALFLERLGFPTSELGFVTVESSHGETVGALRTRPESHVPKG